MALSFTANDLLHLIGGGQLRGSASQAVGGLQGLDVAGPADLAFLGNPKYRDQVPTCRAGVILLPEDYPGEPPAGQAWILVPKPSLALARICQALEARLFPKPAGGIHPTAVIDPTVALDPTASIGPFVSVGAHTQIGPHTVLEAGVVIGRHCRIGADCHLFPRVVVYDRCYLQDRVRLHAGVVIGSDGFGYEPVNGVHQKVPQIGVVVVENDVEIGANSTIDRARFSETRIGAGTKIDNLVQVAHNVRLGQHCILAAQTGVAGSATLGNHVIVAGHVGIAGHLKVGDGAKIAGQSGIGYDIEPGAQVRGNPAIPVMESHRLDVLRRRLPDLFRRVAALEASTKPLSSP